MLPLHPSARALLFSLFAAFLAVPAPSRAADFTMEEVLEYPFADGLAAAEHADRIAWVNNQVGIRNVWFAEGPAFRPRRITNYSNDDGQEITQLTFSPDGTHLVYVRGGDHDANWPAEGNLAPDPDSSPQQPVVSIWAPPLSGGTPVKIADGDAPTISARGVLAYVANDQVWTAPLNGKGKAERLFFDRGKDSNLTWSPDGSHLAFVSARGDHAFIGVYTSKNRPLLYLAPSTERDSFPHWSPDGTRIAFVRRPGEGGPPQPYLERIPHPWSIWVANADDGRGGVVWSSPDTLSGSYPDPDVVGEANLHWAAGDRLVFLAYLDDWPHLYSVPAEGGTPLLLTPGAFMVEHVAESRDRRFMIYDANTGTTTADDDDRRHLFRVRVDGTAAPVEITSGASLEWEPVAASNDGVAFISATAQEPPEAAVADLAGGPVRPLDAEPLPRDFPVAELITPKSVSFTAADGTPVHGQLFQRGDGAAAKPGIIFVHGGPPRQMLLGWHYMGYYSNSYAVNQYLAGHGFAVLSVNYRLGIGYGRKFYEPDHAGPAGAAEYQDVVAGAHFLQQVPGVDPNRIGIWGGSYGGYLTALALARNSDIFKAGVDMHGVHDWSQLPDYIAKPGTRYEQGDRNAAIKTAWQSSPDASIDTWTSPVLLIQGDDDRNVPFHQTIDLARRLDARHVPYEELVIPNEIHGFLRHASWLKADTATADFLARKLNDQLQ
ncbi:MAG TPA: prolyl oligopeptidase family serine peptidase [Rhizomicrobium sp.]|jgi:dipeptidyl aminopeptidase/acylaminoacyl peptidase|nr:prolyl oligopeptidase family serine peptidase [Rhizomicrobium sp.]